MSAWLFKGSFFAHFSTKIMCAGQYLLFKKNECVTEIIFLISQPKHTSCVIQFYGQTKVLLNWTYGTFIKTYRLGGVYAPPSGALVSKYGKLTG